MRVQVTVARSSREYGTVVIEAPDVDAAEAYVDQLLDDGADSQAYCDLFNAASWNSGEHDDDDEVIDAEPVGDEYDADVIVPADWAPPPAEPTPEPRHPATDEPSNAARAARVAAFVREYTALCYGASGEAVSTIVQDLVTDLLHWMYQQLRDTDNPDPTNVVLRAVQMAEEEIDLEKGGSQ
jgi:hypothetical protein